MARPIFPQGQLAAFHEQARNFVVAWKAHLQELSRHETDGQRP
jgi:hypothetical protein